MSNVVDTALQSEVVNKINKELVSDIRIDVENKQLRTELFERSDMFDVQEEIVNQFSIVPHPPINHRIGIWEMNDEGVFERSKAKMNEWGRWASVHKIMSKNSKRRVVLLGESVARGLFYDPAFNVAKELEVMLRQVVGNEVEVIDLACTDQTLPELTNIFDSVFQLSPDLVIIFAGNNWSNAIADLNRHDQIAEVATVVALKEGGIKGLKVQRQQDLDAKVTQFVSSIAQRSTENNVPLMVIIPEFNLLDWKDSPPIVPILTENNNIRWKQCATRAKEAKAANDMNALCAAAGEMVKLDEGLVPHSLFLLAESKFNAGNIIEARSLFELARDAVIWDDHPYSPRCFSIIQNSLKREASKHSICIVDLRDVFSEYLEGGIPDKRLFLDYCHLSVDGIHVAMRATLMKILLLWKIEDDLPIAIFENRQKIDASVEGHAHFAAAIHNAHWGYDCDEIVEYHCKKALEKDPTLSIIMLHYMELMTRIAPSWMCRSTEEIIKASRNPTISRYIIGMLPYQPKVFDQKFFTIMCNLLDHSSKLETMRVDEHARKGRRISLLTTYSSVESINQKEARWLLRGLSGKSGSYFKAYEAESRFNWVEEGPFPMELHMHVRLQCNIDSAANILMTVNGYNVFSGPISSEWEKITIPVLSKYIKRGINLLEILWPLPIKDTPQVFTQAIAEIKNGRRPEYYPIFGEIHSLHCA